MRARDRHNSISLYLHLPFCLSKCPYCDFASEPLKTAGGLPAARGYLDALSIEMDLRAASDELHGAEVVTIYLGGGTPTILPADWIREIITRLHHRFPIAANAEITIEANPGTLDEEKIAALLSASANRLSLGVQSFSDDLLRVLGRAHTVAQAREAIRAARVAGCANLNLDLIYAVPGQSLADWQHTLDQALRAYPEHVSLYALTLEPTTPLAADIQAGRLPTPDDDLAADMCALAAEMLPAAGYHHYEISNFAIPGTECQHNRRYWANAEYLGLGASAHSYRAGIRWSNLPCSDVYGEWLQQGRLPVARAEALSASQSVRETLMLGLRRAEGVAIAEVEALSGLDLRQAFGQEIQQLCSQGLLIADQGHLRIPRRKWIISNEVLSHFMV
jgi:oxygen-independent coproporphyrinogen-3 oxidase